MRRNLAFVLAGFVASLVVLGGTALATNMTFVLGSSANKPDAVTAVTAQNTDGHGGLNGPMIQLTNASTGGGASALGLTVGAGRPPMIVNSSVRVPNLNADLLDGLDASALLQGGGKIIGAKVHLPAADAYTFVINQTGGSPPFTVGYTCHADPSQTGLVQFTNMASGLADMSMTQEDGATSFYTGGKTGGVLDYPTPASGNAVTFNAWWHDGHSATVWVFSYHLYGLANASVDGCYVQAVGIVR